jgi:3-methyl-2-oxobutanoate hydroxymethyltransferase
MITNNVSIPIIRVETSPYCDGQPLVTAQLLGLFENVHSHAKSFASLHSTILEAFVSFRKEGKNRRFPTKPQTVLMKKSEYGMLKDLVKE